MEHKMAKFPSFLEYLNDTGKLIEKPEVETVPDYHGPTENNPPNSKVPYKTPVANKAPEKGESGLSELGDEKLKYEPKTKLNYEVKPDALKNTVKEYVDEKGKVVEKAKTDILADYKGTTPKAPEGKGANPYVGEEIKTKKDQALGDLGDKDLVYKPDTQNHKKTKTESFLNKTKNMSLAEFTKYMLKECGCGQVQDETLPFITAYTTGKFQPHPPEAIRYVTVLADKNQGVLENLVGQVIGMGYLNKLLKVIFEHPQAYDELVNLLNDENGGSDRCSSFVGSLNNNYSKFLSSQNDLYESVSSPMGFENEELEDSDGEENTEGEEDDEEFEDSSEDSEDELEDGSEEDYSDDELEDGSDEDYGDDELEDGSEEDYGDDDEEDHDEEELEDYNSDESDSEENAIRERKLKKKFAHDHILDAMKKHSYMLSAMKSESFKN
jgi:hypothetical protein